MPENNVNKLLLAKELELEGVVGAIRQRRSDARLKLPIVSENIIDERLKRKIFWEDGRFLFVLFPGLLVGGMSYGIGSCVDHSWLVIPGSLFGIITGWRAVIESTYSRRTTLKQWDKELSSEALLAVKEAKSLGFTGFEVIYADDSKYIAITGRSRYGTIVQVFI